MGPAGDVPGGSGQGFCQGLCHLRRPESGRESGWESPVVQREFDGKTYMGTRSILHGYFNPLVFWYQWEYLL